MAELPRVVIAAAASGHGKTTVATGLMAALRAVGLEVSGHKVGPDYIDPGYHAVATGRPGRNLDPMLQGEQRVVPLLLHGAAAPRRSDIAVIEGVMGLFDGARGRGGFASTAHVAGLVQAPVVLVVDASGAGRSVAATVHGFATFDAGTRLAGVILNKVGSDRHEQELRAAVAGTGLPLLGVLRRDARHAAPSRHLGLVPAAERIAAARDEVTRLAAAVAAGVDLQAVVRLACTAPDLAGPAWDPAAALQPAQAPNGTRAVVAAAGGPAFTFRYAENDELLAAAGIDVVDLDPLHEAALPAGCAGLFLGGGFPEEHAAALSANLPLRRAVGAAIASGLPVVAECAGLLYLCRTLDGHPMVGALDATARMTPRLTLGYRRARASVDSVLARAGEQVTGHEFHRTGVQPGHGTPPAWAMPDAAEGFVRGSVHASYLHLHWAGQPRIAARFAAAAHAAHAPHGVSVDA